MLKTLHLILVLTGIIGIACNRGSKNSTIGQKYDKQIYYEQNTIGNFSDFIEQFSKDSTFQISRTKFPIKIIWYDIENDKDSIIYRDVSNFEMLDFRNKKYTGQYDQWEQKLKIGSDSASATIEIRGIENGISVDYMFEKVDGVWMLIEVDDSST